METSLAGRVAFVTGAGRGIGAAIAGCFARQGCAVVIGDIDAPGAESRAEHIGRGALGLCIDVRDRASVERAISTIAGRHGGLDILVNNAGMLCVGAFDAISAAEWQRVVDVNVTGLFHCVQAAIAVMRGRPNACIVNVASISAEKGSGVLGNVWYAATKAAIIAITKGLGRELGPLGVRVNAISPGVVDTDMVHSRLTPDLRDSVLRHTPLGRFITAEDVGRAAVFLASEFASGVTGEVLTVDGGFLRS